MTKIQRRRALLPQDLVDHPVFAKDSPYWTAFRAVQPPPPPVKEEEEEEEQDEANPDEEDLVLVQVLEDSKCTAAEYETQMTPGHDIALRRSVMEAQYPPRLPPPWYETMELELPPAPPLPEGLIGQHGCWN